MNAGAQMFFTALLVAGGLLAYHLLVAEPAHAPPADGAGAPLGVDTATEADPAAVAPSVEAQPAAGLAGSGDEKLARANASRIAELERTIRALKALQLEGGTPSGPRPNPLAPLSPTDLVDADKPAFDSATLETLTAYVDEIDRRRQRARSVLRMEKTLAALGIDLPDTKRAAVADVSLRMQARAVHELGKSDLAPHERRKVIAQLRDEYAAALARVIPPEDVEQILGSRIARRMGLTPPRDKDPRNRND